MQMPRLTLVFSKGTLLGLSRASCHILGLALAFAMVGELHYWGGNTSSGLESGTSTPAFRLVRLPPRNKNKLLPGIVQGLMQFSILLIAALVPAS